MRESKLGRNDPCPCGSGRKYKNCCLALEGLVDKKDKPFARLSQLIATIKLKLDQHYKSEIKKVRKPLQDRFMRLCTAPLPQEQESIFSDWLWFDVTDSKGDSFGAEYFRENGSFMEQPLRDCLQALNASYMSLYEIVGLEGDSLRVKDFITHQEYLLMLKEPLDLGFNREKPLLLGRLAALGSGTVFSGTVLLLKNDDGQGDFIIRHIKYLQSLQPEMAVNVLLKNHGEILFGLFDHANHKALMRLNDIRGLRFDKSMPDRSRALDDSQSFSPVHYSGGIHWYDLQERTGMARIGMHRDYLIAYADLIDDIERLAKSLYPLYPREQWEMVHSQFLFQPPPPELEDIWYAVVKDQETERWLHTPHHELDDKTPQEILKEDHGRERILAMLDSFKEKASGNHYSEDLINYMRERVKQ